MSYSPPSSARPFKLDIPDSDISEWRQLLQVSKLGPKTYENQQTKENFGITYEWLANAKDHWLNKYDWRAEEARINSFPNYKMKVGEIDVHFVALFSSKKDAVPICFMHGWPGSFIEFLPMLELVKKQYEGKELPYHIVVPSLPGYTLSTGVPVDRDWTMPDSAGVMDQLMRGLGFEKYIVQGGDVGSFMGRIMGAMFDGVVGVHLNMFTSTNFPDPTGLSPLQQRAIEHSQQWLKIGTAYAQEHGTRPSTISHVISSNPLALLAWVGEKFLEWSDPATTPSLTTILTNVSLYYFTSAFPTGMYAYRAGFRGDRQPLPNIPKPTGFSFFPKELFPGIKSMIEKEADLVQYVQHEQGGHFAALERPEQLWGDVEAFVGKVWKQGGKL